MFPGLWLVGLTVDAYRVSDAPTKVCFMYTHVCVYMCVCVRQFVLCIFFNFNEFLVAYIMFVFAEIKSP